MEPSHDKTKKMACAPSEDSDQPGHPPSLIRVFACAQWVAKDHSFLHADSDQARWMPRLIHVWVFAGFTCQFVGFVMRCSFAQFSTKACIVSTHNVCFRGERRIYQCIKSILRMLDQHFQQITFWNIIVLFSALFFFFFFFFFFLLFMEMSHWKTICTKYQTTFAG